MNYNKEGLVALVWQEINQEGLATQQNMPFMKMAVRNRDRLNNG
jgi:hypothetical protein